MTSNTKPQKAVRQIGAGAAGQILLTALISYILADYVLVEVLNALQEHEGVFSLQGRTANEISALSSVIQGVQNPILTLLICFTFLRNYFPKESVRTLLGRFGLGSELPIKKSAMYFAAGVAYFLFFRALAHFFPPSPFAVPHPANVINYATFPEKLVFALSAITVVPASEEFLFRGVLYDSISNSWGKAISTICVSAVFIAIHPSTLESGYWLTHAALYVFPVFMILLRESSGTLYAPILAHSAFNFTEIYF